MARTQAQVESEKARRHLERVRAALREQRKLQAALHAADTYREQLWEQHQQLQEAHKSLERSLDRYVELFDFAPNGYLILDEHGMILDANLASAALMGIERNRLTGRPFLGLVGEQHRAAFLRHMTRARETGAAVTELEVQPTNGAAIPVQFHSRATHFGDERTERRYLTAMIDLSELRRGEAERARLTQQRQDAESANQAKDRFIAMLSHELRTPLTPVLAAVSSPELMQRTPQQVPSTLAMIRRNIEIEARLIEDLLDVSRIDHGKLHLRTRPLDLHQLIEDVTRTLGEDFRQQRLELNRELRAQRQWVQADPTRLRQVITNLLANAIKYTPPGGSVMLRTLNLQPDSITLSVRDTGIGLAPKVIQQLFHPFTQADDRPNAGGLGLGLAICRGIVEAHGGQITAHSEGPGCGSTFELTLATIAEPAASGECASKAESAASEPAASETPVSTGESAAAGGFDEQACPPGPARSLRIMLVEDHLDTAKIMSRLLIQSGHDVRVAGTLDEALKLAAEQNSFDVLISDLALPDGSGLDLLSQIGSNRKIPAIALSGFATEDDRRRSREAGFQEHLSKPIDVNQLLSTIAQVAGQRRD